MKFTFYSFEEMSDRQESKGKSIDDEKAEEYLDRVDAFEEEQDEE